MTDSQLEAIIQKTCKTYQVDPNWLKAIVSTESSWNQYAIRYETSYQFLYQPERFAKLACVTLATEIATQKMSWGLGQLMGGLAREQGHTGMLSELIKPEVNIKHMCIRIDHLKKISQEPQDVFSMYNGGPGAIHKSNGVYLNQAYVERVMGYLGKLS